MAVTEIIDRWLDPCYRYFKLRCDDGAYLVRQDTLNDSWDMDSVERPTPGYP